MKDKMVNASGRTNGFAPITGKTKVELLLAAADAGRVLEACALLDELGEPASEELGTERAARLRADAGRVRELQQRMDAASEAQGDSGWSNVRRSLPDLELSNMYERATGVCEVVGEVTLQMSAVKAWTMLREFDHAHEWVVKTSESRLLHQLAPHCDLYRVTYSPILPLPIFTPAFGFQERSYFDALDELGCLVAIVESPELDASSWRGVQLPPDPKDQKRKKSTLRNQVKPIAKDRCTFTYYLKIDSGIPYLPDWILGKLGTVVAESTKSKFEEAIARWHEVGWQQRLESGPNAEHYRAVQERVDAALAKSNSAAPASDEAI